MGTHLAVVIMRIALYGGTFDPFHSGHLAVARCIRDEAIADLVVIMPAGKPYLRPRRPSASPNARLKMCQLATAGERGMVVSDIEVRQPGNSYTVETLHYLAATYPDSVKTYLVVGADTVPSIKDWHRADMLFDLCAPLIVQRPGTDLKLPADWPRDTLVLDGPSSCVSGTRVRRAYAGGDLDTASKLVPRSVHRFILSEELYWCVPTM